VSVQIENEFGEMLDCKNCKHADDCEDYFYDWQDDIRGCFEALEGEI